MWELTAEQIEAMTPEQRRDLIIRLERPMSELLQPGIAERVRRARLGIIVFGSLVLIPWIVFLGATLPDRYIVSNWPITWIGFDALLVTLMAATAYLGARRRVLVVLTGFATAVMLICDAWFDLMTAGPRDFQMAEFTAAMCDLPLAAILITGTLRLFRLTAIRMWLLEPTTPLWRLPLLP